MTINDKIMNIRKIIQEKKRLCLERAEQLLIQGVKIRDPERIDIRGELICGKNVEIDLNVIIEGQVVLGDNVHIGANCILKNALIKAGCTVHSYSMIEDTELGQNSFVGPYGRIRPGSKLGDNVQIGNFVEIKQAKIGAGCRINHLSFVGDANLSRNVTIGAGTITCNYSKGKVHNTQIESDAFIGSGCNLIAPVKIGKKAVIGAGSTITRNVDENTLTLGRAKQVDVKKLK